ncbi:MAG: tRNA (N(6)-L-threonylcarbamoyladenosine(37)-C(2))-methylthiotransferase MtaB [Armatimonadetes bacterium]|nr:tRNA (N(6)-L-threonylcarbamoyladenosine(37)-C(2))-methylthiotransferase MtaB [Armatimonadota bacterium]
MGCYQGADHANVTEGVPLPGRPARVALVTLGCKLNQFETEQMRELLEQAGCETVEWGEVADIYVVNSCTVTARADRDTRRLARFAHRLNPAATVVVAGCVAEVHPESLRAMPEVDLVVPNRDKARLAELLRERGILTATATVPRCDYGGTGPMLARFAGHTRAFVKVQEGCDADCAYCIIPRARGRPRSIPPDQVEQQVRVLAAAGHPEIVLIGTHLGRYGADLNPPTTLAQLCQRLCEIEDLPRLRLSSIEPGEVDEQLQRLVADGGTAMARDAHRCGRGKVCRHLHLPLQSGSDAVLKRMGRPYRAGFYADLVRQLVAQTPGLAVGADVLVGFPGETEEEFTETLAVVEALPLAYLHVFTYSPRPGTRASEMPQQVPPEERKRRNHILRDVSAKKQEAFARAQVGAILEVVVERRVSAGLYEGISDNYLRVLFRADRAPSGPLVAIKITKATDSGVSGTAITQGPATVADPGNREGQ